MEKSGLTRTQKAVSDYEEAFREFSGAGHALSFYSGRSALYAVLRALNTRPGDEIVLPAFTCVAVPSPVIFLGAKPVYADIDPRTLNLTGASVGAVLTPGTKAVIFQHTFGMPEGIDEVACLCRERGIPLIEDCSQAVGVAREGRWSGRAGKAAFFSSHWIKTYTTGVGGMLTTDDDELARAVDLLRRSHSQAPFMKRLLLDAELRLFDAFFSHSVYWAAYRVRNVLSALGLTPATMDAPPGPDSPVPEEYTRQLSRFQALTGVRKVAGLAENLAVRRYWLKFYREALEGRGPAVYGRFGDVELPYLHVPVAVKNKRHVMAAARRRGVMVFDWPVSPVHPLPLEEASKAGYIQGSCPNAEKISSFLVGLPTDPVLTRREAERIVKFLIETGE